VCNCWGRRTFEIRRASDGKYRRFLIYSGREQTIRSKLSCAILILSFTEMMMGTGTTNFSSFWFFFSPLNVSTDHL